jgi:hypothetical protein
MCPLIQYRFTGYQLDATLRAFVIIAEAGIRMTPFESHLRHLPCAFRGATKQQSRHSKSLLGKLEVRHFQDGHETIDLARRGNDSLQFSTSCLDEVMVLLPILISTSSAFC